MSAPIYIRPLPEPDKGLVPDIIYLHSVMKTIEVVAAIICKDDKIFVTQRRYGDMKVVNEMKKE